MAENTKKKTRGGFYLIIAILTCPAVYLYGWFRTALDYPGEFSFVYYFPTFIAKIAVGVLFSLGVVLLVIRCKHRNSKGKIRLEKTYIFGLFLNILCLFFMIHFMSGERIPPSMNKVVFPGEGYVAVAPGLCHVIALKEDGSIVGWGNDEYLRDIPEGNDFVSIAAGSSYSLALRADGTIAAWGDIYSGHWLDNRAVTDVPRGDGFNAIAAGELHCLALKSDGRIICWGTDFYKPYADIPVTNNFVAIDTCMCNLALKTDGSIVSWGGLESEFSKKSTPPTNDDFTAVSIGDGESLALKSDGSLIAWSNYDYGSGGSLENVHRDSVLHVPKGTDYKAIAMGAGHALALREDGSIVAWGYNLNGQAYSPSGKNYKAIVAFREGSLAIDSDGRIIGWGAGCWSDFDFENPQD